MIFAPEQFQFPRKAFVFIRHGETDANRAGVIAGAAEPPLNATGRRQASALEPVMAKGDWQAIYVSPQDRARQTARLIFPDQDLHILDGLRERNWGDLEGQEIAKMCPRFETPPNGEGFDAMCQRVSFAIGQALADEGDKLTVIVAHSGVGRSILYMTGFDADGPRMPNATPILFRPVEDEWQYQNLTENMITELGF